MIKTTITETTEKYDENGNLIEKIVREERTEDDEGVISTDYSVCAPQPNDTGYWANHGWTTTTSTATLDGGMSATPV